MHSAKADAVLRTGIHDTLLLGVIALSIVLAQRLLQLQASQGLLAVLAGLVLGYPLVCFARSRLASEPVRACCWMLLSGGLGMFAGMALDHPLGLISYLSLCRTSDAGFTGDVFRSFTQMPSGYLAMLAACWVGEWTRQSLRTTGRAGRCRSPGVLATSIAMLAGMALAHGLATDLGADLPARTFGAGLLISMLAGMSLGLAFAVRSFQGN